MSESPPPDATSHGMATELSRMKRKLASVQEELAEAIHAKAKRPPTTVTMGRGIRRLVTLFDSLDDLIDEADQQFQNHGDDAEPNNEEYVNDETYERQRESRLKLAAYATLLHVLPNAQKGANDARSDDVRRIKEELAFWLNLEFAPAPPMLVKSRSDRGLQGAITGRLLCPIDYKWEDEEIRSKIQTGTLDISEDSFLRCFYPHGNGDLNNVEKGFLRSQLLVKTYCAIFTSPSSSEAFDGENEDGPARKKQRTHSQTKATKSNVAMLLHMEGTVTPRSIAYAAVLLVFNLTDATQWGEAYGQFNFRALYSFIVDYFDDPSAGPAAVSRIKSLLCWWDKQVFPTVSGVSSNTRRARNRLAAQRSAREESVPV